MENSDYVSIFLLGRAHHYGSYIVLRLCELNLLSMAKKVKSGCFFFSLWRGHFMCMNNVSSRCQDNFHLLIHIRFLLMGCKESMGEASSVVRNLMSHDWRSSSTPRMSTTFTSLCKSILHPQHEYEILNSVKLSETVQKKIPFIVWLPTIASNRHVTKLIQNLFFWLFWILWKIFLFNEKKKH